jgi:hypothetical protein
MPVGTRLRILYCSGFSASVFNNWILTHHPQRHKSTKSQASKKEYGMYNAAPQCSILSSLSQVSLASRPGINQGPCIRVLLPKIPSGTVLLTMSEEDESFSPSHSCLGQLDKRYKTPSSSPSPGPEYHHQQLSLTKPFSIPFSHKSNPLQISTG